MNDLISRKAAIDRVPTADVVEVVRCRECKYKHPYYCEMWSRYGTVQTSDEGFCYMGRATDEQT